MNKFKKQVFSCSWLVEIIVRVLLESYVTGQSCCNILFLQNLHHLMTDLTVNFACELRDEFCACTIENWMVVGKDYILHASSHSKNVASACRVQIDLINTDNSAKFCFTSISVSVCRIIMQTVLGFVDFYPWYVSMHHQTSSLCLL